MKYFFYFILLILIIIYSVFYYTTTKIYSFNFIATKNFSLTKLINKTSSLNFLDKILFKIYFKIYPISLKIGKYKFKTTLINFKENLNKSFTPIYKTITIYPGKKLIFNLKKYFSTNEISLLNKELLKLANKHFNVKIATTEGLILADTYKFDKFLTISQIAEILFKNTIKIIKLDIKNLPLKNRYQLLILASIIEKEAANEREKPLVASVFLNRLRKKMKLQSCATVNFLLKNPKKKLSFKDIKINSPYNTYIYKGLPPSPICCTSFSTIKSILTAPKTDYLYFISNGKKNIFSKTLKHHNKLKKLLFRK